MRSILTAGDSPSLRSSSKMNPSWGTDAVAGAAPLNAKSAVAPRLARAVRRSVVRGGGSRKARESPSASRASAIRLMLSHRGASRSERCCGSMGVVLEIPQPRTKTPEKSKDRNPHLRLVIR
eukprot:scaffold69330_cov61-Phaeocystis_antarctica.AAC.7